MAPSYYTLTVMIQDVIWNNIDFINLINPQLIPKYFVNTNSDISEFQNVY